MIPTSPTTSWPNWSEHFWLTLMTWERRTLLHMQYRYTHVLHTHTRYCVCRSVSFCGSYLIYNALCFCAGALQELLSIFECREGRTDSSGRRLWRRFPEQIQEILEPHLNSRYLQHKIYSQVIFLLCPLSHLFSPPSSSPGIRAVRRRLTGRNWGSRCTWVREAANSLIGQPPGPDTSSARWADLFLLLLSQTHTQLLDHAFISSNLSHS